MKLSSQLLYVFVALSIFPLTSSAEPKNLNAVMAKATPQELNDLPLLLKQIMKLYQKMKATKESPSTSAHE